MLESIMPSTIIDLRTQVITPYNYDHVYPKDDFNTLMKEIIKADLIIFATPIYWYSMSGIMKNFFDRMTDCLKIEKELGRQLKGKRIAALSCGSHNGKIEGFFSPFKNIAQYLGMHYSGDVHTWINKDEISNEVVNQMKVFAKELINPDSQI